jgi:hypothetical protein
MKEILSNSMLAMPSVRRQRLRAGMTALLMFNCMVTRGKNESSHE